jgi:hypothetical protein
MDDAEGLISERREPVNVSRAGAWSL